MRLLGSIILTASIVATAAMHAAENHSMDHYRSIIDRNPFGLKPPPPPPAQPLITNTPAVKNEQFYLTGISTIGYPNKPKKAFLMNKDNSKKEYSEKFYNMQINDKQGDLRLDDIDEKAKRVKVTYRGEEMWLSMKDNGVPTPTSTAAPQPGMPAVPGQAVPAVPAINAPGTVPMPMPLPGATPTVNAMNQPIANPSMRRLPRSNQFGNNAGGMGAPVYAPTVNPAAGQDQLMHAQPAQPAVSPEQQALGLMLEQTQGGPPAPPIMTP